jgi:hypothetical protein
MKIHTFLLLNAVLVSAGHARAQTKIVGMKDTFVASKLSGKEIQQIVQEVEQSAYSEH